MITDIKAINHELGLEITLNDVVCHHKNIFIRKLNIRNYKNNKRNLKIFFHQQFEISEANVGDTVYYNPLLKSLIHYKGKRYFLMNGCSGDKKACGISEYATGLVGEYGMEGTYKDAEDGKLSGNPIEHGSVDSVLSFNLEVKAEGTQSLFYWICVGRKYKEVAVLNEFILKEKPQKIMDVTEKYWKEWVNKTKFDFYNLSPKVVDLFKRSLLIINTHVDKRGAIIASSDSDMLFLRKDTYNYMWPRDGALVSRSLDRAGYNEITENFFKFCNKVLTSEGYLFHKYRPDGSLGSSWHSWLKHGHLQLPIQEDQLALVLDALWKHFLQHGEKEYIKEILDSFIRKAADFMLDFIDKETGLPKESYDLWEEKLGIHTFTSATVYAGFDAAANFEKAIGTSAGEKKYRKAAEKVKEGILKYLYDEKEKRFVKMLYYGGNDSEHEKKEIDPTIDASSTYGIFEYKVLSPEDPRVKSSMESFTSSLHCNTEIGGYARYDNDGYYRIDRNTPGNPWFITTLWLAEYYIQIAKTEDDLKPAVEIFEWVAAHALPTGVLSEQLNPNTGAPVSVAPLTWSHAGLVIAINKYLEKLDNLGVCNMCNPPKLKRTQEDTVKETVLKKSVNKDKKKKDKNNNNKNSMNNKNSDNKNNDQKKEKKKNENNGDKENDNKKNNGNNNKNKPDKIGRIKNIIQKLKKGI